MARHKIEHMKGKTVLITGASSGIGFQAAKLIAKKGAKVFVVARNEAKAQKTVSELQKLVPEAEFAGLHADFSSHCYHQQNGSSSSASYISHCTKQSQWVYRNILC